MKIRSATLEDAAELAAVHVAAWRTAYRGIMPDRLLDGLDEREQCERWTGILATDAPREFTVVAEPGGRLAGFATGGPDRGDDGECAGELYAIYLLSEFRRQGIGTALLAAVFERLTALGMTSLRVWVLDASPFRVFYEKHGGFLLPGGRTVEIDDVALAHVAYGWPNLNALP